MLTLVRKAEDWTQRAAAAIETERLPLKRLRDVLHSGSRLPVRAGGVWRRARQASCDITPLHRRTTIFC